MSVSGVWLWRPVGTAEAPAPIGAETRFRLSSVAVLPVVNLSDTREQDPLADGMTDLLINQLARLSGFERVVPRTSMMRYRATQRSLREIGRELGVDLFVEASILPEAERVRVNVSLIEAVGERNLWSGSFERPLRHILTLQRDVAQAIAREVELRLTPEEEVRLQQAVAPVAPRALSLYLQAVRSPTSRVSTLQKLADLEQAVALDPGFPAAYAELAILYALGGNDYARADAAVERALAIDPNLPIAHVALGLIRQWAHFDWAGAEAALRRAVELAPLDPEAHHELAMLLMRVGRFEDALASGRRALFLGPRTSRYQEAIGEVYLYGRGYDAAVHEFRKSLDMDPNLIRGSWFLGEAHFYMRRYEEAVRWYERAWGVPVYAYPALGRRAEALAALDSMATLARGGERNTVAGLSDDLLRLYIGLGEHEQALAWLEHMVDQRLGWIPVYLKVLPHLDPLRAEPRFRALLKNVGLDG